MASETIFFSYSRADSAFVLKLAKDLRNAGFNIWLDQLDIRPGSRWDDAIQSALNESKTLIVILSSSSVASENVMDEVSFAIGNKKNLIPVLLNECVTPFRLSRFQHVDFTGDQEKGLSYLIETLDYNGARKLETDSTTEIAESPSPGALEAGTIDDQTQKKLNDSTLWQEAVNINSIASYTKYINESATGLHSDEARQCINTLETGQKNEKQDKQLWEKIVAENTIRAYTQYVHTYPDGNYKQDALAAISKLEEIEKKNQEIVAENKRAGEAGQENELWAEATGANTISSYKKYLDETKTGLFKQEAQEAVNQLEVAQKEKELETKNWKDASNKNTTASYNDYLQQYPDGMYRTDAAAAINQIAQEIKQQKIQVKTGNAPRLEKKSMPKKYYLIGGSVLLIAFVIWAVTRSGSGNTAQDQDTTTDQIQDSIIAGHQFGGGIIFYIDSTGEHGLIAQPQDLGELTLAEALRKCDSLNDGWRLPTYDELTILYSKKAIVGGFGNAVPYQSCDKDSTGQNEGHLLYFANGDEGWSIGDTPSLTRLVKAF